ncbi:hypothetical protein JMJ35_006727 [Cladonia borealis]|uniref:Zn(2)-C6 fungal-type domain-containing protein n=1 Tax=Cladonia borealis TaxID=184061 RepID=A0AA39QZX2_9LECA|nr:hypothetical protein JMJ35_006727 [Cladonia borealis]
MAYRGKLSRACLPCRKRKLRCDLDKQGCTQCARAKLTCSGYRDTEALRFRDETSVTRKRVNAQHWVKSVPRSVSMPICSQAKDLFYYNYVVGANKPFNFLQAIYSPTSKMDYVDRSLNAVALAYLANQRYSPRAEEEARQQYVLALSSTGAALRNSNQARQDSTILGIMLLDLYEKITNKEPALHGAWAAHLSGALALVKYGEDEQFEDPNVLSMLMRLSTNLLISCVASGRPFCTGSVILRSEITTRLPGHINPKWQESELMVEFACLRQEIEEGALSDANAISSLVNLDFKFAKLSMEVPPSWQYKTTRVKRKSKHHYDLFHHIYPAEHVVQMWNTLRLTRIVINELICCRCSNTYRKPQRDFEAAAFKERASGIIRDMASDICASVPQYVRHTTGSLFQHSLRKPEDLGVPCDNDAISPFIERCNAIHHVPCYRLIFPLYVAAQSGATPASLKQWVVEQLQFMADYHAIRNAAAVASVLESGETKHIWHVYAMLGSYAFVS